MVNGLHSYLNLFRSIKAHYTTCQHSLPNTFRDCRGCHAMCQPGHKEDFLILIHTQWEQFGIQYFVQGHFDVWTGGARDRTNDLPISGWMTCSTCWGPAAPTSIWREWMKANIQLPLTHACTHANYFTQSFLSLQLGWRGQGPSW